jgi:hypothetical protein
VCSNTFTTKKNKYFKKVTNEKEKNDASLCILAVRCRSWTMDREGHILEGVGVTPDIEIDLDIKQFKDTGKDTQLDCALQHIRNRK